MITSELNPQQPVTSGLSGHWHKVAALIMVKLNVQEVVLTPQDMISEPLGGLNIVAHETGGELKIKLVDNETAHLLAHS